MAELIVNANEPKEGLSEQEQEYLAIGEKMQGEQESLLAGKYQNAQELEKAYLELQQQFSSRDSKADESDRDSGGQGNETSEGDSEEDSGSVDLKILNDLWDQAVSGEFTQETLDEINGMDAKSVAELYLAYRNDVENANAPTLNEENGKQLKDMVGGEAEYQSMLEWGGKNLQPQEIDMFDAVMNKGDAVAAFWAVQALALRYQNEVGKDGNLLTGRSGVDNKDVFKSQAQVVAAMNDPRYDRDPAYRQEIFEKIERSNLEY